MNCYFSFTQTIHNMMLQSSTYLCIIFTKVSKYIWRFLRQSSNINSKGERANSFFSMKYFEFAMVYIKICNIIVGLKSAVFLLLYILSCKGKIKKSKNDYSKMCLGNLTKKKISSKVCTKYRKMFWKMPFRNKIHFASSIIN